MSEWTEAIAQAKRRIDANRTDRGGWPREVLASWGVPWPPPKGWRQALIDQWAEEIMAAPPQDR